MHPHFNDTHHSKIERVSDSINRPLWSVLIPTHNCANYLRETLGSVLIQDPGEDKMEIIVVDDYSTKDNPEEVVEEIGKGRVRFVRQPQNVGKTRNYETGLQLSNGILIHQLHGDDRVLPGFYDEIERLYKLNREAGAFFTRSIYIDSIGRWVGMTGMVQQEEGIIPNMAEKLYVEQLIQTPSMVVKREVYEKLGGFDRRFDCFEDWEMWTRIANYFPISGTNKVLAEYREHENNATNQTFLNGTAIKTHSLLVNKIDSYTSNQIISNKKKEQKKQHANFIILSYRQRFKKMKFKDQIAILKILISLGASPKHYYRLLKK